MVHDIGKVDVVVVLQIHYTWLLVKETIYSQGRIRNVGSFSQSGQRPADEFTLLQG